MSKDEPEHGEGVIRVAAFLDRTQDGVERLPMRQRVRTHIWGIRYYAGLPKWVAYVWIQTVSEYILIVPDPRHNHARGKAPGVPLRNCVVASLQAQRVEVCIRQFSEYLGWQAVRESHHLGKQQLPDLFAYALLDLTGCIKLRLALDNLIPVPGK